MINGYSMRVSCDHPGCPNTDTIPVGKNLHAASLDATTRGLTGFFNEAQDTFLEQGWYYSPDQELFCTLHKPEWWV